MLTFFVAIAIVVVWKLWATPFLGRPLPLQPPRYGALSHGSFFLSRLLFFTGLCLLWPLPGAAALKSKEANPSDQWRRQYVEAKSLVENRPNQACQKFETLSKAYQFPLRKLAYLRSLEVCKNTEVPIWNDVQSYIDEPWLADKLLQIRYQFIQSQNLPFESYLFWDQHQKKLSVPLEDKITLLKNALKASKADEDRARLQSKLETLAPRFIKNPDKDQWLAVAKDHRKARDFAKAIRFYEKVIASKGSSVKQKWSAFKGIRKTYKLEKWKKQKSYIAASKNWAQFLSTRYTKNKAWTRLHHKATVEYIRTLWTEKGQKEALPVLRKALKDFKGNHSLQTLLWLDAKMAEEIKDYDRTISTLKASLKERSAGASLVEKIRWNLAWNLRRQKQWTASSEQLVRLQGLRNLSAHTLTKYIYWQARNLMENKSTEPKGHEKLHRIIALDPYGFYAALAHRSLGQKFTAPADTIYNESDFLALFKKTEDYQTFNWYASVGETEIAQQFLQNRLGRKSGWSSKNWAQYLKLLQSSGNYLTFFKTFHSLKISLQKEISKLNPSLLFPTPYLDDVKKAATRHQVPPALIYSIMKQESGFDPRARSFADAFGLMQLIPQVAEKAAEGFTQYKKVHDLYRPRVNIHLGAKTLRDLFQSFNGQFILSVASYNASAIAVRGWVQSRFKSDPIEFIEDIPYAETKGYVKLVMRNYISYRRFLKDPEFQQFPEESLKGLKRIKAKEI